MIENSDEETMDEVIISISDLDALDNLDNNCGVWDGFDIVAPLQCLPASSPQRPQEMKPVVMRLFRFSLFLAPLCYRF
jgi:hypothetical protein